MVLLKMVWFTVTPPALIDGACAVVAVSLFHNITVLGKNEKGCWSILEGGEVVLVTCMTLSRCEIEGRVDDN